MIYPKCSPPVDAVESRGTALRRQADSDQEGRIRQARRSLRHNLSGGIGKFYRQMMRRPREVQRRIKIFTHESPGMQRENPHRHKLIKINNLK